VLLSKKQTDSCYRVLTVQRQRHRRRTRTRTIWLLETVRASKWH